MPQEQEQTVLQTHNARVFSALRTDILAGRLHPGAPLRTDMLRERYGAGISPVREALMRLEAEGLVRLEHNKGFRVLEVSAEHLEDLTQSRIEIEGIALRWSIAKGQIEWEAGVIAAFHRLARHSKLENSDGSSVNEPWRQAHRMFHEALAAACGSPIILGSRDALFDQVERYVALAIAAGGPVRDDIGEHRAIMEAVLERDTAEALRLNKEHIERTALRLEHSFRDGRFAGVPVAAGKRGKVN